MKSRKSLTTILGASHAFTAYPNAFVYFDLKIGTQRFEVMANADGSMPLNQVASLLDLHCVGFE
jgi:hypothetical protein